MAKGPTIIVKPGKGDRPPPPPPPRLPARLRREWEGKTQRPEDGPIPQTSSVTVDEGFLRVRDGVRDFPSELQVCEREAGQLRTRTGENYRQSGKTRRLKLKGVKETPDGAGGVTRTGEYGTD